MLKGFFSKQALTIIKETALPGSTTKPGIYAKKVSRQWYYCGFSIAYYTISSFFASSQIVFISSKVMDVSERPALSVRFSR